MNFNLVNLFTRKQPIAGIEISDSFVRVALLGVAKKDKAQPHIVALAEEQLPPDTVVRGVIQDKAALTRALVSVVKKSGASIRFVIVSIPTDEVYSRVFSFPKVVQGSKLEESMKLTVGFQLPFKPESVHLDWEKVESSNPDLNEVYLAAIPTSVSDVYAEILHNAKLSLVAIETHPLSLLRTFVHNPEDTILFQIPGPASTAVHIFKDGILLLSRTIPHERISSQTITEEIRKIQDAYNAEHDPITTTVTLDKAGLKEPFATHPDIQQNPGSWLISLGAAERGLLERSNDTLVSLMPVGTEEAYEYQKAITFAEFMTNMTIGLAIFFVVIYIGAVIFMNTLQDRSSNQLTRLNTSAPSQGSSELEQRAMDTNLLLENLQEISGSFPRWSPVVEEVRSRVTPGIVVSTFSFSGAEDILNMNGIAKTRTQLNDFKKKLSESEMFTGVNIPLNYLDQKENIPFSASFKLKDPDSIFTQ